MNWDTLPEIWNHMIIRMMSGQAVWRITKALLSAVSLWNLPRYPGWAGSRSRWLWAPPRQNTLLIVWPSVRQSGCWSSSVSYLYTWWIPLWFSVTTRDGIRLLMNPVFNIAPAVRHHLGYGKSMIKEAPSHWDDVQDRAPRKDQICDFPERLGVVVRPLKKGPACCIHWALGPLGGLQFYWSNIRPQGDSPSPGGARRNKMIRSLVGQDDSLSCVAGWLSSPVRPGLMCSPWRL